MALLPPPRLVVFGASNILSDIFDAALSVGWSLAAIVLHQPEPTTPRSLSLAQRLEQFSRLATLPQVLPFDAFSPVDGEVYLLGPTTPSRQRIVDDIAERWPLRFATLVHRTAYVSPLANLSEGVFVGAHSVIAPGTTLAPHVFVNRGVTIGHDNHIGAFSRIQPGAHLGGLSTIGRGVTIGLGARVVERLQIGDGATVAAGAVVRKDVPAGALVAGPRSVLRRQLGKDGAAAVLPVPPVPAP